MYSNNELVLLFSGGTDSTYTAVLMDQRYERIHLITYDRLGFLNTRNSEKSVLLLKNRFGQAKFVHKIINIDGVFRKISYGNYFKDLFKYRFFLLSTCGLCKLAMHWQTIIYCLDNNIKEICDGSNREMRTDPFQDERILNEMKLLYDEFGITYFNPIFKESRQIREKTIFGLGLSPVQRPKRTRFSWERQPFCTQEHLFIKFFEYARTNWKGKYEKKRANRYEKKMLKFHKGKINFIKEQIYKYLKEKETK